MVGAAAWCLGAFGLALTAVMVRPPLSTTYTMSGLETDFTNPMRQVSSRVRGFVMVNFVVLLIVVAATIYILYQGMGIEAPSGTADTTKKLYDDHIVSMRNGAIAIMIGTMLSLVFTVGTYMVMPASN